MSIVSAKKKIVGGSVGAAKNTHKKRRPQKKKMTLRQKIKKILSKNAHSRNVGAFKTKKNRGHSPLFFLSNFYAPTILIRLLSDS